MKIELINLSVRDLVAGCHDEGDGGAVGHREKLDIRQR